MSLDHDLDTAQVAALAGITSRTLRHYDAIGLVRPRATRADGRRLYGRTEILRLQRVLILRALGLGLDDIARVLADDTDEVAALKEHRAALVADRQRLDALIGTVDLTIAHLEGEAEMEPEDVFAGLPGYDAQLQRDYRAEATERWGSEAVKESTNRMRGMTREDAELMMTDHAAISEEAAAMAAAGVDPGSPAAQELVARHYAWVCRSWTPDADAYRGLGAMYVDDERFRATYEAFGAGTAQFLREGIEVFAASMS
jgi:DNA-binding transcriptional MerR regulator